MSAEDHKQANQNLNDALIRQVAAKQQFEALCKLYEAAAITNNGAQLEQYREQLHTVLDCQLDICNEIMHHTRLFVRTK